MEKEMNLIEIQNELLRRVSLLEGDLTIFRNVITSLDQSLMIAMRRINTLEQTLANNNETQTPDLPPQE